MAYLYSILPIILYVALLFILDSFSLIKKRLFALSFMWGVIVCIIISMSDLVIEDSIFMIDEEVFKYILVVYLFYNNKYNFFSDAAIYGAAIGAGFAAVENILYIIGESSLTIMDCVYRGAATSFMHMSMTAMSAVLLLLITREWGGKKENLLKKILFPHVAIIPSVLLHTLHNSFILPPAYMLVIVVLGNLLLFIGLFKYNEISIYRWLDHSMYEEVKFYSSITKGEFSDTKAGQYLLSIKEQFDPLIFFDMIVCVQLSLELSVMSKRILIMKEAEFDVPQEDINKIAMAKKELAILKKRIGKIGYSLILPIFGKYTFESFVKR